MRTNRIVASSPYFDDHYNHRRDHKTLDNLTLPDVYFGRGQNILDMPKEIKRWILGAAATTTAKWLHDINQNRQETLLVHDLNCPENFNDAQFVAARIRN